MAAAICTRARGAGLAGPGQALQQRSLAPATLSARAQGAATTCSLRSAQQQQQQPWGRQRQWQPAAARRRQCRRRQCRPAAVAGGSGPVEVEGLVQLTLSEYDTYVKQARDTLEEGKKSLQEADALVVDARRQVEQETGGDMPAWLSSLAARSVESNAKALAQSQKRYEALVAGRAAIEEALRGALGADLKAKEPFKEDKAKVMASWLAAAGYSWATQQADDKPPGREQLAQMLRDAAETTTSNETVLWGACLSSLIGSWLVGWAGSGLGFDAYRLLHEWPEAAAAGSWLAWTAPFVAGTVLSQSLAPETFNKHIFRILNPNQQTFFKDVPFPSYFTAAAVLAFCQALVYQGLWQDVFTAALGGVRDPNLASSAVAEPGLLWDSASQQQFMGTLVGGLSLPAVFVAPSAAILTGAIEAAWTFGLLTAKDLAPQVVLVQLAEDNPSQVTGSNMLFDASGSTTLEDRLILAGRTALAGTYLALEATLTGSLWLAVGTSAAGLVTSVLLNKRAAGGGDGGVAVASR